MVEEGGVAAVIKRFLELRDQGQESTEIAPATRSKALSTQGTKLIFRSGDVDFVPLEVSRWQSSKVCVCVKRTSLFKILGGGVISPRGAVLANHGRGCYQPLGVILLDLAP